MYIHIYICIYIHIYKYIYRYTYIYMLRQIHQIADLTKSAMGIAEFVKSATDCRFCQIGKLCC